MTLDLYKNVYRAMLPTPSKTHYIFNLRDISKVMLLQNRTVLLAPLENFTPESESIINKLLAGVPRFAAQPR